MGLANSRQEAFWEACGFGHVEKAKHLLKAGDIDINWVSYTNDCCPIHTASQGKKEIVEMLIQHKCDVNVKDIRGNLPLHHAAMKGHADIVTMLLDAGSEIDVQEKNGWTALHNAAYWCHPEVVRLLIKRGCNVHLQNKDERTALHECSRSQSKDDQKLAEIALLLTEAGTDVNAMGSDFFEGDLTALMYAAYHNHPEVAGVLIDAGCELDARSKTYWTALHWAAERENDEIVYILLDAGANPVKKCLKGETAYDRAKSEAVKEILSTAMQLHRELHRISITEPLPLLTRARAEQPFKPMCDPNFKSESFLPASWKPSSLDSVKNLINEKKAQWKETAKKEKRKSPDKEMGLDNVNNSAIKTDASIVNSETDTNKSTDKEEQICDDETIKKEDSAVNLQREDSDGDDKQKTTAEGENKVEDVNENDLKEKEDKKEDSSLIEKNNVKPISPVNVKELIREKRARLAAITNQNYRNELAKRTGASSVITGPDHTNTDPVQDNSKTDPGNTGSLDDLPDRLLHKDIAAQARLLHDTGTTENSEEEEEEEENDGNRESEDEKEDAENEKDEDLINTGSDKETVAENDLIRENKEDCNIRIENEIENEQENVVGNNLVSENQQDGDVENQTNVTESKEDELLRNDSSTADSCDSTNHEAKRFS